VASKAYSQAATHKDTHFKDLIRVDVEGTRVFFSPYLYCCAPGFVFVFSYNVL
jgi:hypothetical protein